jgi:uncharacterized protein (TIGR00730 family)
MIKRWWVCEYLALPFATGRIFSVDAIRIARTMRLICQLPGPIVTFFGGREAYYEGKYATWATTLAQECVRNGMAVVSGGGPGIMAAANCGAQAAAHAQGDNRIWTLGICVDGVDLDFSNTCAPTVTVPYFFMRKWFLMSYASAIVVLPGGIGTLDELFELLNLIKARKQMDIPVILMGVNYWHSLLEWYKHAVDYELIKGDYGHMLRTTDNLAEVIALLKSKVKK